MLTFKTQSTFRVAVNHNNWLILSLVRRMVMRYLIEFQIFPSFAYIKILCFCICSCKSRISQDCAAPKQCSLWTVVFRGQQSPFIKEIQFTLTSIITEYMESLFIGTYSIFSRLYFMSLYILGRECWFSSQPIRIIWKHKYSIRPR